MSCRPHDTSSGDGGASDSAKLVQLVRKSKSWPQNIENCSANEIHRWCEKCFWWSNKSLFLAWQGAASCNGKYSLSQHPIAMNWPSISLFSLVFFICRCASATLLMRFDSAVDALRQRERRASANKKSVHNQGKVLYEKGKLRAER